MSIDLDDLLAESMDLAKQKKQLRQNQKSAVRGKPQEAPKTAGWLNKEEMEAHAADVARIKIKTEGWKSLAGVLLCYAQICSHCGSEHKTIEGIFIRKYNDKLRITNLVKPGGVVDYADLPKEVEIRTSQVSMCVDCYPQQGWQDATINII